MQFELFYSNLWFSNNFQQTLGKFDPTKKDDSLAQVMIN